MQNECDNFVVSVITLVQLDNYQTGLYGMAWSHFGFSRSFSQPSFILNIESVHFLHLLTTQTTRLITRVITQHRRPLLSEFELLSFFKTFISIIKWHPSPSQKHKQ